MIRGITIMLACTIIEALQDVRPGAQWVMGSTYSDLVWLDKSQLKPTLQEVDQAVSDCKAQEPIKNAEKAQAVLDAKDSGKLPQARIDALTKILGL